MSGGDVSDIVARLPLGFERVPRGAVAIASGQRCEGLVFLTDGEMEAVTTAAGGAYSVAARLQAPALIEPERLFGLAQGYERRYTALTLCHLLTVRKDDVLRLVEQHIVFRLNLLNALSAMAQRRGRTLWRPCCGDTAARLRRFLSDRCSPGSGPWTFSVTQQCLADELRTARRDVAAALRTLGESGALSLGRGRVTVESLHALL